MDNKREKVSRRLLKLNERDPKAKITWSHKLPREIKSIRFDNLMEMAWKRRNHFFQTLLVTEYEQALMVFIHSLIAFT